MTDPAEYYKIVNRNYSTILEALEREPAETVCMDIDETIHCNRGEMPAEFANYIEIPHAADFAAAVAHRRRLIFLTGREESQRDRTLRDLARFTYSSLHLWTAGRVWDYKQGVIQAERAVGIGDQLNDISAARYKIHNPYYTILADGTYQR
jgi:predicted secreted acid phosphatase